uniref:G_PROTEIN_RECEP_F1_2 domain-containing protein n=1 Tax=Parastrongyloides trichosuri TaxID=131310 RepID=A0A0N5A0C6_PARTI
MIKERVIALSLYVTICTFGVLVNGYCFFKVVKLSEFKHFFGYICICQLLSNIVVLSMYLLWSCPALIFLDESGDFELLNQILGKIGILAWNLTMYAHLAAAFNRFIAMFFPTKYKLIFDKKTIIFLVVLIWLLAFCHVIPYIFFGCQFRFYVKTLTWGFVFNKCTIILATFDFYFVFSNVTISLFIDITIFIKLGLQAKKAGTFNVI